MIGGLKTEVFSAHAIGNKNELTIISYFTRYFTRYATGYSSALNLSYLYRTYRFSYKITLCHSLSTAQLDSESV